LLFHHLIASQEHVSLIAFATCVNWCIRICVN
jgi:hypothetical protein